MSDAKIGWDVRQVTRWQTRDGVLFETQEQACDYTRRLDAQHAAMELAEDLVCRGVDPKDMAERLVDPEIAYRLAAFVRSAHPEVFGMVLRQ